MATFLDEAHTTEWYEDAIADPDVGVWLIFDQSNKPVGYGVAGPNTLPIAEGENAGEIKRVYIDKAAQGSGRGRQLVEQMLAWLDAQRFDDIYVGVWSLNHGAQRLYARYGFEKVGEYGFDVGDHVDLEFIFKRRKEWSPTP